MEGVIIVSIAGIIGFILILLNQHNKMHHSK